MKGTILASSILFIFIFAVSASSETIWHSSIIIGAEFHWNSELADLRDLTNEERYTFGIGGGNVEGGDIGILIEFEISDFDFFYDNVLFDRFTAERDVSVDSPSLNERIDDFEYYRDYYENNWEHHLLILPTLIDNQPFFDFFFSHTDFIENITHSQLVETSIDNNLASYFGIYNETHPVIYQWDVETGLLVLKQVRSKSNLLLRVVQGEGISHGPTSSTDAPFYSFFVGLIIPLIVIRGRRR
jgi:hypothetical protein